MTDKPISKMTGKELDALYASQAPVEIDGWAAMKVAEKREALMSLEAEANAPGDPAPQTHAKIKLTESPSEPWIGYVHGLGEYRLAVGAEHVVPVELLAALRESGAKFEKA